MRLFSFDTLYYSIGKTIRRFPLTLICVYLSTGIIMWYNDKLFNNEEVAKLIYTTLVGGLFFLSARIATESYNLSKSAKGILYITVFSLIIIYYISIPTHIQNASRCFAWISIGLVIIGHLLVSIAPYFTSQRSTLSFRSYNYQLLLNFAQAVFYSLVLFATLSLALVSIDALFDINVTGNTYSRLFIFLAGIFNTSYFLSQFPSGFDDDTYGRPKGLKVLAEYIMIPVLIIYALILYAYIIKIMSSSSGIAHEVRYLIISFLGLGLFTYLINYFISSEKRSSISKCYVKLFFLITTPVSILLLITVWKECNQRGVTDELYIHGIIAIWMILLGAYIIISKKDEIKWIPITLIIVSIITFYIPIIGVCSISIKSQLISVTKELKENNLLVNGKLVKLENGKSITSDILNDGLRYLDDYNQLDQIIVLDKDGILGDSVTSSNDIIFGLNINKAVTMNNDYITIYKSENIPIDISKYTRLYYLQDLTKSAVPQAYFDEKNNAFKITNKFNETLHMYRLDNLKDSLNINTRFIDLQDDNSYVRFYIEYLTYDRNNDIAVNANGILVYRDK